MTRKKAVLYARVSTEKDEQKQSLEIQESIIEKYCNDKGFKLIKPYYKENGKSGTNMRKRKEFLKMMKDAGLQPIKSNSNDTYFEDNGLIPLFDIIIVKEASRFSRNQTEALSALKALKSKGVEVYFISSNTSTTDNDWEFTLGLYFNLSQTESKNLSTRVKMSKLNQAKENKYAPAVVPYGYKRIYLEDGTKKIVIDDKEASIVKDIFGMYKKLGGHSIARILNERNVFTKSGKLWSNDKITRLIQNPIYRGSPVVMKSKKVNLTDTTRVPTKESERVILEDVVKAIVSEQDFNEVQNIRLSRTTTNGKNGKRIGNHKSKDDIFAGKLVCSTCGANYARHIGEGKKINYMCQTRRQFGEHKCNNKAISYSLLVQGLDESRIRFNDIANHGQHTVLNEAIKNLSERNFEIQERIRTDIENIKADERKTFLFMRDLDKFSTAYELANEELEKLNLKRLDLEEQFGLIKDETVQRFLTKVELKKASINKAKSLQISELDSKLLHLHKVVIDDEWVRYYYTVQAYDEEIEEFNNLFSEIVEPIVCNKDALFEETFQRGFRKLISRAEEQEIMNEMYEAMEDLVQS